jgi:hypothetical protein
LSPTEIFKKLPRSEQSPENSPNSVALFLSSFYGEGFGASTEKYKTRWWIRVTGCADFFLLQGMQINAKVASTLSHFFHSKKWGTEFYKMRLGPKFGRFF